MILPRAARARAEVVLEVRVARADLATRASAASASGARPRFVWTTTPVALSTRRSRGRSERVQLGRDPRDEVAGLEARPDLLSRPLERRARPRRATSAPAVLVGERAPARRARQLVHRGKLAQRIPPGHAAANDRRPGFALTSTCSDRERPASTRPSGGAGRAGDGSPRSSGSSCCIAGRPSSRARRRCATRFCPASRRPASTSAGSRARRRRRGSRRRCGARLDRPVTVTVGEQDIPVAPGELFAVDAAATGRCLRGGPRLLSARLGAALWPSPSSAELVPVLRERPGADALLGAALEDVVAGRCPPGSRWTAREPVVRSGSRAWACSASSSWRAARCGAGGGTAVTAPLVRP